MTNNVESCKKINGRVQTFRFSVFTMGRQELCAENAKKTQKLEKLKRKLLKGAGASEAPGQTKEEFSANDTSRDPKVLKIGPQHG